MKKYTNWAQSHWSIIAVVGGGFWTFVVALYTAFVLPQIDEHIDKRIMKIANDSLVIMVDHVIANRGSGFRGQISEITGIDKHVVADSVSMLIQNKPTVSGRLTKLENDCDYQQSFNFWALKQIADKQTFKGVTFWTPPDGNVYFRDVFGLLWDAKYDAYDDVYYFYPSYGNGNRLKCE